MVCVDGFELIGFWGQKVESEGPSVTEGQRQRHTELDAVDRNLASSFTCNPCPFSNIRDSAEFCARFCTILAAEFFISLPNVVTWKISR